MAGMEQPLGHSPVVGQQQQALGIQIQPTHRPHPHTAVRHQLGHVLAALLVGQGGHIASGLVQHQPGGCLHPPDGLSVHCDTVPLRVGPVPQPGRLTVHRHPARQQIVLGRPPGADAGGGQYFLQPLLHAPPLNNDEIPTEQM
ncbi:hypothetical protein SDC9_211097 [bioreactor metagenome]|uniref:Uncharacterized protein n=1 Tax=bioreactor metagenome TaxID=1076179 RepID=A0A645JKU2_9ZZZZ